MTSSVWTKDVFKPQTNLTVRSLLEQIKTKIIPKLPKLKHFTFGISRLPGFYVWRSQPILIPPLSTFTKSIFVPIITTYYQQLQTLDLQATTWNIFKTDKNLLELIITKLTNLKKLSIVSLINQTPIMDNIHYHCISLKELDITLKHDFSSMALFEESFQHILLKLFSSFIGINKFEICFENRYSSIDWQQLFNTLFREKRIYSMDHNPVLPLQSIIFNDISYFNAKKVIKALLQLKDELYFDLQHFGIDLTYNNNQNASKYNDFVNDYMVPMIKDSKLQSIKFSCGSNYKIKDGYFESTLKLLSIIPSSMISIELTLPKYFGVSEGSNSKVFREKAKIKGIESTKLVSKLCEMTSEFETNTKSKLETIIFDNLRLSTQSKEYLTFFFGYNNKIFINDSKYYLGFVDN